MNIPGLWNEAANQAKGQWPAILFNLAPALREALEKGPRRRTPCPVHGGTDGFRLFHDYTDTGGGLCNTCGFYPNGFMLLAWVNGWRKEETLNEVARWLRLDVEETKRTLLRREAPEKSAVAPEPPKLNERARERLRQTWHESVPAWHPDALPLKKYLERRGVPLGTYPEALRFHRALNYFDDETKKSLGCFPAMVSMIVNAQGKPVNLHRTYLTNDGDKALVPKPKKEMPSVLPRETNGGAIRLYEATEVLAVAEGIETALAVRQATGLPVWSCVNAVLLEQVVIPSSVKTVLIWADRDKPQKNKRWPRGEEAARRLQERLVAEGHFARTYLPAAHAEGDGVDWLDVLNSRGKEGFPAVAIPTAQELEAFLPKIRTA